MASCLANPFIKASVAPLILVALAAADPLIRTAIDENGPAMRALRDNTHRRTLHRVRKNAWRAPAQT